MDKRCQNFNSTDVGFLVSAVKKWRHVTECKKSDHASSEENIKAWIDIKREFNSKYSHTFLSHKVLKTKYGNLKSVSKQNFAADKRATYGTGGGSAIPKTAMNLDHSILEICQNGQVLGDSSNFDGDAADECDFAFEVLYDDFDVNADDGVECNVEDKEAKDAKAEQVSLEGNIAADRSWKKYTSKMLKMPMAKPLKLKKETTKDSWVAVVQVKLEKYKKYK